MARRWYPLRTRARCEHMADSALRKAGFEVFFPIVEIPRPLARKGEVPLFPGYLFVHHDFETETGDSPGYLPGILGWVRFGDTVPAVPDDVIAELARRVGAINTTGGLWHRFRPGDRVRVISRGMDNLAEVLEEPRSPEARVRVLMQFLGRRVQARIPWHDLQPLDSRSINDGRDRPPRRTRGRGRRIRGNYPLAAASV